MTSLQVENFFIFRVDLGLVCVFLLFGYNMFFLVFCAAESSQ